jgi:hypothetical protein
MADLAAVTVGEVAAVEVIEQWTLPAGEAIDAGEVVGIDANGLAVLADANPAVTCKGIAINSANQAGITITAVRRGIVDIGDVMDAMGIGDAVYISDTAGLLADAQVNGVAAIGEVVPAWGAVAVDKLLRINV